MELIAVFKKSLELMRAEPKVFVPRIFTTFFFTFFLIYAASISLKMSMAINREMTYARNTASAPDITGALLPLADEFLLFAAFFLLVYVVDILTYGMYARIASDFHAKKPISLTLAIKDAVSRSPSLFLIGLLATVFVGFFILVYLIFGRMYITTQNPLFLVLALLVMLLAVVAFALVFFFAVPAAMVEKKGTKSAVMKSASIGMRYRWMVIKVNFLFVALVFIAMVVVMATEFHGLAAAGAIILFVIARLFQAMVYTYISLVNPELYLSIEEAKA